MVVYRGGSVIWNVGIFYLQSLGLVLSQRDRPETGIVHSILAVNRWDEKAGLRRDAVYAPKLSTCSKHR